MDRGEVTALTLLDLPAAFDTLGHAKLIDRLSDWYRILPGMTEPPNSFTARGPVTLTAILLTQPTVYKQHSRCLPKNSVAKKLRQIFQVPMKTRPFSADVNL